MQGFPFPGQFYHSEQPQRSESFQSGNSVSSCFTKSLLDCEINDTDDNDKEIKLVVEIFDVAFRSKSN